MRDHASVTQILAAIIFQSLDLGLIVRRDHAVPLEPILPTIGHGVRQFDIDYAGSLTTLTFC